MLCVGYSEFQVMGMIEWGQKSRPKKKTLELPTKPPKIPCIRNWMFVFVYFIIPSEIIFPSSGFLLTLETPKNTSFACASQNYAAKAPTQIFRKMFIIPPQKSLLKSSHTKHYLPNFPTPPPQKKKTELKTSNPQKILRSSPSLGISSTPPPPLPRGYVYHVCRRTNKTTTSSFPRV